MKKEVRERRALKLFAGIKIRANKLKEMNYMLSDRYSSICLFDNEMFKTHFMDLSDNDQQKTILDHL